MSRHERLLQKAKEASDELFGDTSVSRAQTRDSLADLAGHIHSMMDTLKDAED